MLERLSVTGLRCIWGSQRCEVVLWSWDDGDVISVVQRREVRTGAELGAAHWQPICGRWSVLVNVALLHCGGEERGNYANRCTVS